jgi:excisionase family DNA binding protein
VGYTAAGNNNKWASMPSKGNLMTVTEAAKAIGVTEETVRRYLRERKLKAEKKRIQGLKKVWLVHPDEIRRFQENN